MGLALSMLGLTVQDMRRSLEFYRRLGLDVPEGDDASQHIEVRMPGEVTVFLDTRAVRPDVVVPDATTPVYPVLLEFFFPSRAAVDAKYAELIGLGGYQRYHAPFFTTFGMYFALVNDPDGHTVLLSAELETPTSAQASQQMDFEMPVRGFTDTRRSIGESHPQPAAREGRAGGDA
jgi:predicted lactoylglutathione lyase